jgi:hypothetical protein
MSPLPFIRGASMADSNVDLIGIRGRKFTRIVAFACLFAVVMALNGCGGDDESDSERPAATAPAGTEMADSTPRTEAEQEAEQPPETDTEEAEGPEDVPGGEDMPGGAGDEEPARTLALFTARGGRIMPRVVRVPAFIAVKVELRSADGQTYALRFGDTTITAGGQLSAVSTTIDGLRPGEAVTGKPASQGNPVRIEATAEPGP